MKKILSIVLISSLQLSSLFVPVVFAQEVPSLPSDGLTTVTSQVKLSDDPASSSYGTSANPFFDSQLEPSSPTTNLKNTLLDTPSAPASPLLAPSKADITVSKLLKHTFRMDEPITLSVGNVSSQNVSVALLDASGATVNDVSIKKQDFGSSTDITVSPELSLRPGKYTLSITSPSGTTTQDFSWGVLAINTNKSIYEPGETADLAMAVLDEKGNMVCDATVNLTITDPAGATTILSTTDNSITVSPQCLSHDLSLTPDYHAQYQVGTTGTYSLSLSATTKSGASTIDNFFKVASDSPFSVERVSATRIYPAYSYPVSLKVTAKSDFSGTVVEYVPSNFTISPYASGSGEVISYDGTALPNQYTNMHDAFGLDSLSLALPFNGSYKMSQGFGGTLTDPDEKALYASFGLAGHDGIDFSVPSGTAVKAVDAGTVALAGEGAYGTTVVITHSWGKSYYGHLSSTKVKVGDHVEKGQEIALSGNTGLSTGAHLHFGIKPLHPTMGNGYYGKVDPSPFLGLLATGPQVLGVSTISDTATSKLISWNLSVKKGNTVTLGYNFKAPSESPQLYTLGPLSFFDSGKQLVFKEARKWQIAVDADSSAGPNNCSVSANDTSTGAGTAAWGTVGTSVGACANAGTTASPATLTTSVSTQYLKVTGFGFSIPTNAVIHGIQFSITKKCTNNATGRCVDKLVHLVKAGAVQTSDTSQADTATAWNTTNTAITYGSSSTIPWGGTWAYSDINSSGFGVAFSAAGNGTKAVTATLTGFITATITYNQVPGTTTNDSPSNGATNVSTSSTLQMHATDPESDTLEYKVNLYSGSSTCTGSPTVYDQTSSTAAWDQTSYSSGATATLTPTLATSTTYSWQAQAIDQAGSSSFGALSTCTSFTTTAFSGPTLDQLMRHGKYLSNGVEQPFTF